MTAQIDWARIARQMRRDIRQFLFTGEQRLILEYLIDWTLEAGRQSVLLPNQKPLVAATGLSKGHVSHRLTELEGKRVIQVRSVRSEGTHIIVLPDSTGWDRHARRVTPAEVEAAESVIQSYNGALGLSPRALSPNLPLPPVPSDACMERAIAEASLETVARTGSRPQQNAPTESPRTNKTGEERRPSTTSVTLAPYMGTSKTQGSQTPAGPTAAPDYIAALRDAIENPDRYPEVTVPDSGTGQVPDSGTWGQQRGEKTAKSARLGREVPDSGTALVPDSGTALVPDSGTGVGGKGGACTGTFPEHSMYTMNVFKKHSVSTFSEWPGKARRADPELVKQVAAVMDAEQWQRWRNWWLKRIAERPDDVRELLGELKDITLRAGPRKNPGGWMRAVGLEWGL